MLAISLCQSYRKPRQNRFDASLFSLAASDRGTIVADTIARHKHRIE
jgi:hypothetical protein